MMAPGLQSLVWSKLVYVTLLSAASLLQLGAVTVNAPSNVRCYYTIPKTESALKRTRRASAVVSQRAALTNGMVPFAPDST